VHASASYEVHANTMVFDYNHSVPYHKLVCMLFRYFLSYCYSVFVWASLPAKSYWILRLYCNPLAFAFFLWLLYLGF